MKEAVANDKMAVPGAMGQHQRSIGPQDRPTVVSLDGVRPVVDLGAPDRRGGLLGP